MNSPAYFLRNMWTKGRKWDKPGLVKLCTLVWIILIVCHICIELRITDMFGMLKLTERSSIRSNQQRISYSFAPLQLLSQKVVWASLHSSWRTETKLLTWRNKIWGEYPISPVKLQDNPQSCRPDQQFQSQTYDNIWRAKEQSWITQTSTLQSDLDCFVQRNTGGCHNQDKIHLVLRARQNCWFGNWRRGTKLFFPLRAQPRQWPDSTYIQSPPINSNIYCKQEAQQA
jgi:hypothetical protein